MEHIKIGRQWYNLESLTENDKKKLGLIDEKKIKKTLKETPKEIKEKPCKKKKGEAGK